MTKVEFINMKLTESFNGLVLRPEKFISIRETEYIHWCIREEDKQKLRINNRQSGHTDYQHAKQIGIKLFRIYKSGSRIAQETPEKALERLIFLKRKQLQHLRRDISFIELFLDRANENGNDFWSKCEKEFYSECRVIPKTADTVAKYFVFD